ncbi:MAG: AMP-binding protein [Deltaproteobacteria bacterium]|nr:AMP-binding protein [Deltaproteobacteria bacterium]
MTGFKESTIGDLLKDTAQRQPEADGLIYPQSSIRLTYAELYAHCRSVAKGFMALGIKRGDPVSVWTTNLPEWVYMQFGLSMIGAVLVTVNTSYKSSELEYILRQSDSITLVFMEQYRDANFYEIIRTVLPELDSCSPGMLQSEKLPKLKNIVYIGERTETPGMNSFADVVALGANISDQDLDRRMASLDVHDTINMQYTSGTTGFPKGVMLTHYNIVNHARTVGDVMGLTPDDRLLIQVPLFHCFGCVMSTLNSVYHGSTMVVLEYFSPLEALQYIEQEHCTAINGVPTMFIAMLNHEDFDNYDMSSLRTGIMAGAPCPVETMDQVRKRMHCPEVVIAFGQTEVSPVMTMTRRDDPVELRVSTVGRLLPGIEGRVVNPDSGETMPPNTQGEIVTRSACVMKGYYKMEEATRDTIDAEGWLHTGDLGIVDEAGYFKVTGRIKEMIIRGGENIYPREIEEFLHGYEKINDIYIVGIPDKKYGEQLLAVIKLNEGQTACEDDLVAYCQGKIARHKIPRYWEFVTDFPMTASGKVQKFKLVEEFVRKYAA